MSKWYGWEIPLGILTGGLSSLAHAGIDASQSAGTYIGSSLGNAYNAGEAADLEKLQGLVADERAWNSAEAQKNRDFQERLASTQVQRGVADIKAAGLNPWLAVQGASGVQAAAASGDSASNSSNSALAHIIGSNLSYQSRLTSTLIKGIVDMASTVISSASKLMSMK